jgi:hypothetical protein
LFLNLFVEKYINQLFLERSMKKSGRKRVEHAKERRQERAAKDIEVESKNVLFVGLNSLDPMDQELIKNILYDEYIKIERKLKLPGKLKLHFKSYERGGREKYSVHLLLEFPGGKPIVCTQVYDPVKWDPVAEVHMLLKKARTQISHRFKTDTSFQKSYF